jgi:hypothetical protein
MIPHFNGGHSKGFETEGSSSGGGGVRCVEMAMAAAFVCQREFDGGTTPRSSLLDDISVIALATTGDVVRITIVLTTSRRVDPVQALANDARQRAMGYAKHRHGGVRLTPWRL